MWSRPRRSRLPRQAAWTCSRRKPLPPPVMAAPGATFVATRTSSSTWARAAPSTLFVVRLQVVLGGVEPVDAARDRRSDHLDGPWNVRRLVGLGPELVGAEPDARDLDPARTDGLPAHAREDTIRTHVRAACRRRRVSRLGRAAGRPAAARAGRSSSAAASCSRRATKRRRTASGRRWAGGKRDGSAPTRSSSRPRHEAYTEASRAMFAVFEDASPVVEGLSIDEAFLDVRGMERIAGTPVEIAVRLRAAVRERVGLPVTVGVARTKFLAKVASGVAKPDGLIAVPPDRELAFLHPLPVECVWGVGPATARRSTRGTCGRSASLLRSRRRRSSPCSAGRPAVSSARSRTTATSGAWVRQAARLDRLAARVGLGRHSAGRSTRRRRPGRPDHATNAGSRRVGRTVGLRLRFGDSRARRGLARCRSRPQHADDPLRLARCWRRRRR